MKEDLIKSAKEKGFKSNIIGKSAEAIHSDKDFYYLWMCELQSWLREEKGIIVLPYLYDLAREDIFSYTISRRRNNLKCETPYLSCEEALEKGLKEALKLIP